MLNIGSLLLIITLDLIMRLFKVSLINTLGYNNDVLFLHTIIIINLIHNTFSIYKFKKFAIKIYLLSFLMFSLLYSIFIVNINLLKSTIAIVLTYAYALIVIFYIYKFNHNKE
jgi:hypothetical protein